MLVIQAGFLAREMNNFTHSGGTALDLHQLPLLRNRFLTASPNQAYVKLINTNYTQFQAHFHALFSPFKKLAKEV